GYKVSGMAPCARQTYSYRLTGRHGTCSNGTASNATWIASGRLPGYRLDWPGRCCHATPTPPHRQACEGATYDAPTLGRDRFSAGGVWRWGGSNRPRTGAPAFGDALPLNHVHCYWYWHQLGRWHADDQGKTLPVYRPGSGGRRCGRVPSAGDRASLPS